MNDMDLNIDDNTLTEVVEFCDRHSLESTGIELYKVGKRTQESTVPQHS